MTVPLTVPLTVPYATAQVLVQGIDSSECKGLSQPAIAQAIANCFMSEVRTATQHECAPGAWIFMRPENMFIHATHDLLSARFRELTLLNCMVQMLDFVAEGILNPTTHSQELPFTGIHLARNMQLPTYDTIRHKASMEDIQTQQSFPAAWLWSSLTDAIVEIDCEGNPPTTVWPCTNHCPIQCIRCANVFLIMPPLSNTQVIHLAQDCLWLQKAFVYFKTMLQKHKLQLGRISVPRILAQMNRRWKAGQGWPVIQRLLDTLLNLNRIPKLPSTLHVRSWSWSTCVTLPAIAKNRDDIISTPVQPCSPAVYVFYLHPCIQVRSWPPSFFGKVVLLQDSSGQAILAEELSHPLPLGRCAPQGLPKRWNKFYAKLGGNEFLHVTNVKRCDASLSHVYIFHFLVLFSHLIFLGCAFDPIRTTIAAFITPFQHLVSIKKPNSRHLVQWKHQDRQETSGGFCREPSRRFKSCTGIPSIDGSKVGHASAL